MSWFVVVFMLFTNNYDRPIYIFQYNFKEMDECIAFAKENQDGLFYLAHKAYDFKRPPLNLMCVSEQGIKELNLRRRDEIEI